jgi:hypothetical protein
MIYQEMNRINTISQYKTSYNNIKKNINNIIILKTLLGKVYYP